MCRLAAYTGPSLQLADLVTRPERSIIRQSFDARERLGGSGTAVYEVGRLNADAFGVGWYVEGFAQPCVLTDVGPAWHNRNLENLASKTRSEVILTHVRAAGPGMAVCKCSCHPFTFGRYLFMHNGQVCGFRSLRRKVLDALGPVAFNFAIENSCSDSAVAFAILIDQLEDPSGLRAVAPARLQQMMQHTIRVLVRACEESGTCGTSLLNFVLTDGVNLVATRCVHGPEGARAASLYFASGSSFEPEHEARSGPGGGAAEDCGCAPAPASGPLRRYRMARHDHRSEVVIVASEPLTEARSDWTAIPTNHMVLVTADKSVLLSPVLLSLGQQQLQQQQQQQGGPQFAENARLFDKVLERFSLTSSSGSNPALRRRSSTSSVLSAPLEGCDSGLPMLPRLNSTVRDLSLARLDGGWDGVADHDQPVSVSSARSPSTPTNRKTTGGRASSEASPRGGPGGASPRAVEPRSTIAGHESPVMAVAVLGELLLTADSGSKSKLCAWDLSTSRLVESHDFAGAILSMCTHAARGLLFLASTDSVVYVRHVVPLAEASQRKGQRQGDHPELLLRPAFQLLVPDVGHVLALSLQTDLERLLIGTQDACLRCVELPTRWEPKEDFVLERRGGEHHREQDLADGSSSSSSDGASLPHTHTLPLYVARSRRSPEEHLSLALPVTTHLGFVHDVGQVGGDDEAGLSLLASAGGDGAIMLWDAATLELADTLVGHRGAVLRLVTCGALLVSGSSDCTIRAWDVASRACRRVLLCSAPVLSLAYQPGRVTLISGLQDGAVCVWSLRTFALINSIALGAAGCALCLALPPRISQLACGTSTGELALYSLRSLAMLPGSGPRGPLGATPQSQRSQYLARVASPGQDPSNEERMAEIEAALDLAYTDDAERASAGGAAAALSLDETMLEALRQLVRIRSVSAAPEHHEECWFAAKALAMVLDRFGCSEVKLCCDEDEARDTVASPLLPVVVGTLPCNRPGVASPRTVVYYGHYDVVDARVERGWDSDPFQLSQRDGHLYGRGVTDNKGPLLAAFFAAKELHARGDLPCNCTFLFEGQEESGLGLQRRGFSNVIKQNALLFRDTSAVIISNNYWIDDKRPCLTYGMRGVIDLDIEVAAQGKDLHAGVHGGAHFEAVNDLVKVLASLTTQDGQIAVQALRDNVRAPTPAELAELARIGLSADRYAQETGVGRVRIDDPVALLRARWSEPSLSIAALRTSNASYQFRRVPSLARAAVSLHFVPDQSSDAILAAIRAHLQRHFDALGTANELTITARQISDYWLADTSNKVWGLAAEAIHDVWGEEPLFVREGGSYGGISSFLERTLGAPVVHLPIGSASDNAHLPNERIRLQNILSGKSVLGRLLAKM